MQSRESGEFEGRGKWQNVEEVQKVEKYQRMSSAQEDRSEEGGGTLTT
jgi:hypothetical protein